MALAQRDWRALLEFLLRVHSCTEPDRIGEEIALGLRDLFSADVASFNELDTRARRARFVVSPESANFRDSEEILGRFLPKHPFVSHFARNPNSDAVRMSDFMSQREFRRSPLYNEFYRRAAIDRLLGLRFATGPGGEIAIGLCRKTTEFTEHERELMSLLRPHLTQAFERAETARQARSEMAILEASLDAVRCAVAVVSRNGTLRLATPRARSLLAEFFQPGPWRQLPEEVQAWLRQVRPDTTGEPPRPRPPPLVAIAGDRELCLRVVERGSETVLVFQERWTRMPPEALFPLGLTPREAQVLASVAMGRTDVEIGESLGISFRTVKKHVEHILAKLGADNRTAATARAHGAVDGFRN